ncbi:MAG: hypothetical protein WC082_00985 [Victivallales bacterium]
MKLTTPKPTQRNEKGIALIFSLIMLSLLLVMALSFALDSMYDQKAAYNSANVSSAGLSAKAQLNQVILMIENHQANFTTLTNSNAKISASRLYSVDSSTTQVISTDMLTDVLPVDGVLEYDASSADNNDPVLDPMTVNWNYVRDSNNQIIGRTAFVVIPKEKVPFNSLISKTVDESGGAVSDTYNEQRIGKEVSEINVRNCLYQMETGDSADTYTVTPAMADIMNWLKTVTGVTSNRSAGKFNGSWSSYSYLFGKYVLDLEGKDSSTCKITNDTDREKFQQNFMNTFNLDANKDQEAFWADLDNDTVVDSGELFNRFDLTRTNWSTTLFANDLVFTGKRILLTNSGTAMEMETWDGTDSTNTSSGLPWLAFFGYKTDGTEDETLAGTFSTVANRRYQIAANLKDYCDNDLDSDNNTVIRPTSDVDPADWVSGSDVPAFTGNEKTPYINKIGVRVELEREHREYEGDEYTDIKTRVQPVVGLINIYGSTYDKLKVKISGTISTKISTDGGTNYTTSKLTPFDKTIDFETSAWPTASPGYLGHTKVILGDSTNGTTRTLSGYGTSTAIKVTAVNITKVVLYNYDDETLAYDYVKTLSLSPDFVAFQNTTSEVTQTSWFGFAVHDPRQNLNADDWQALTPTVADTPANVTTTDDNPSKTFSILAGDPPYYGAPNSQNSYDGSGGNPDHGGGDNTEAPTAGSDPETAADPANGALSTAYIRNAPMESPWELGLIHRGAKWETLNLKVYNSDKAYQTVTISGNKYILGGGAYSDGDANILDQVKMTSSAESPEKINLATQKTRIFKALFSQIYLGCTIDSSMSTSSMAAGGTVLSITDTELNETDSVMKKFETASTDNRTRACIAEKLEDIATTKGSATTDAAQEELIGKIINLTKIGGQTGSGDYTVVIVAQTIRDIGGDGSDINITKTSADESATQPVPCQLGSFDIVGPTGTSTLDSDWKRNVYGDDITATQKIIAEISKDAEGKVTIKNLQYVD